MIGHGKAVFNAFFGTSKGRRVVRESRALAPDALGRITDFEARFGNETAAEDRTERDRPLFILSAGWRSGSTLLQRMVMARQPDMLIWGEPYDRAQLFDRMLDQIRCFSQDWPPEGFIHRATGHTSLSDQWVANLYPEPADVKRAHRAFFDTLFAEPARRRGYTQWGVKEVRLGMSHVHYLRWLYPNAKFLLLYRNPLNAYRSYRKWRRWFRRWPEEPVLTPYRFGRNWSELTSDFLNGGNQSGTLVLRYEDLDTAETTGRIERYLGWPVERPGNMERIQGWAASSGTSTAPLIDRVLLQLAARGTLRRAGYQD